jgi:hypothetical protein
MVDKSFCCERGYMAALDKVNLLFLLKALSNDVIRRFSVNWSMIMQ